MSSQTPDPYVPGSTTAARTDSAPPSGARVGTVVWGLINAFQVFDSPYILTSGGPGDASRTVVMYIYETGFAHAIHQYGLAAAASLILAGALLVLTLLQLKVTKSGEGDR